MPNLSNIFNKATIFIDNFLDWVPFASTINNAVDIIAKSIFGCTFGKIETKNELYKHLEEKSYTDCLILMIPGVNVLFKIARSTNHYGSNVVSDIGADSVVEKIDYNKGRTPAHITDNKLLKNLAGGGLFFVTAKDLKESFKSIESQFKSSNDNTLKEDVELCHKMMENYFEACKRATPTLLRNIASLKLPNFLINIGTAIMGKRPDTELFIESVTALKQDEYEFGSVNIKAKESSGYHTVARAVLCREPAVDGKGGEYDLIIGNVGMGCGYHITDENGHVIPYVLKGMTLEQITDKEFVNTLIDISTCAAEDNEYAQNFYFSLFKYANKKDEDGKILRDNIKVIGWESTYDRSEDILTSKLNIAGEYKDCASPLQKMGNCIYKSPEALIKTMLKLLKGRDSDRMIFLLLMNRWENDFKEIPKDVDEKTIYDVSVKTIIEQIKDLAKKENKTIKEIIESYCTETQQEVLKLREIYNPDETSETEILKSPENLITNSDLDLENSHILKKLRKFNVDEDNKIFDN